jgi:hypothetical protein
LRWGFEDLASLEGVPVRPSASAFSNSAPARAILFRQASLADPGFGYPALPVERAGKLAGNGGGGVGIAALRAVGI